MPARAALFVLALTLAAAGPAHANSILSIGGLGEPQLEEPARLRALGGAGVAEHGPREISLVNPASLSEVERILLEVTVLPAFRRVNAASVPVETVRETTFPSARAAIALPGGLVLGASYVAGTDAEFSVAREDTAGARSTVTVDGSGGINFLRVSLARRIVPALRLGVDWEVIAGSYRESWVRTFSDSGLATARDSLDVRYPKKGRWRFGAQLVKKDWAVGAAFETSQHLPLDVTRATIGASERFSGGQLEIPPGLVLGASAPLRPRLRAVAQYRRAGWSRSSLQSDLVDFRAQERFSVGLERKRATEEERSLWARLPLRVGGYLLRWPDLLPRAGAQDVNGGTAAIDERALTLGAGLVTKDNGGGLDVSLELGSRGDRSELGVSERFVRLGISFLVSDETWKGSFHK
ncbi:MAG: hypothetical protein E6K76_10950 [Candidatus Eisenbacteria bacterium]|uniref:Uncharacterized protein n=1 Tax=Eiseniibacteriota bacterium TaxID=2212470 RepID=A0A538T0W0_UNCEI|nr:MAG: hypothetical protein E6K76_10950 [Candidatus Eisenbacteria bacterium]